MWAPRKEVAWGHVQRDAGLPVEVRTGTALDEDGGHNDTLDNQA